MKKTACHFKLFPAKTSLRSKLLLSLYIILLPVLIISSVAFFVAQYQAEMKRNMQVYQRFSQSVCQNIASLQQDVLDIDTYFTVNDDIHKVLNSPREVYEKENFLWTRDTPISVMNNILAVKGHITTVILYPENGLTPYYVSRDASVHNTDIEDIRKLQIYYQAQEAAGDVVWTKNNKNEQGLFIRNLSDKIVSCRELYDLSKKKRLGFLAASMKASSLIDICTQMLQYENEGYLILDSGGQEFLEAGQIMPEVRRQLETEKIAQEYREHPQKLQKIVELKQAYIFINKSSNTGIIVCYVSPKSNWYKMTLRSGNVFLPILLMIVLVACAVPLSMLISKTMTRPVEKLCLSMEKFKNGDFEQQVCIESQDEIGRLSENFNEMVVDLRNMIQKNYIMTLREREMELNTLQAQINPHFLYNTLDSLYYQAIGQDNHELAQNILTLSRLFRLILSQGNSTVSVASEVELVTCYLKIQKMRFKDRLKYQIRVEEEIKNYSINKLLLQPFVENAIVHGLESRKEGGVVSLQGFKVPGRLIFLIEDNGKGMEQEQIDRILFKEEGESAGETEEIGHYAIHNVRERLKLSYGEEYELSITSSPQNGTRVRIAIPI